jgi:hypothetical protein
LVASTVDQSYFACRETFVEAIDVVIAEAVAQVKTKK